MSEIWPNPTLHPFAVPDKYVPPPDPLNGHEALCMLAASARNELYPTIRLFGLCNNILGLRLHPYPMDEVFVVGQKSDPRGIHLDNEKPEVKHMLTLIQGWYSDPIEYPSWFDGLEGMTNWLSKCKTLLIHEGYGFPELGTGLVMDNGTTRSLSSFMGTRNLDGQQRVIADICRELQLLSSFAAHRWDIVVGMRMITSYIGARNLLEFDKKGYDEKGKAIEDFLNWTSEKHVWTIGYPSEDFDDDMQPVVENPAIVKLFRLIKTGRIRTAVQYIESVIAHYSHRPSEEPTPEANDHTRELPSTSQAKELRKPGQETYRRFTIARCQLFDSHTGKIQQIDVRKEMQTPTAKGITSLEAKFPDAEISRLKKQLREDGYEFSIGYRLTDESKEKLEWELERLKKTGGVKKTK